MVTRVLLSLFWRCLVGWMVVVVIAPSTVDGAEQGQGIDMPTVINWSTTFQMKLRDLESNVLQTDEVVAMINGFVMDNVQETEENRTIDNLACEIETLLKSRFTAAQNIAKQVQYLYKNAPSDTDGAIYNSLDTSTWDDEFMLSMSYDERYKQNVTYSYSTIRLPDFGINMPSPSDDLWSAGLDEIFRKNVEDDSTMGNQYFGSATGTLRTYPGAAWEIVSPPNMPSGPGTTPAPTLAGFNVKYQPWYVLGASAAKDVVIVLDLSDSMGNLYDVRKAAMNVVSGLTSQDFVNVVTFNANAVISSCWQKSLVRSTPENKQTIMNYLDSLVVSTGQTNIQAGLTMAVSLLDNSYAQNQTSGCQQVVLLLTDGITSATSFEYNDQHNARLFAYVLNAYTDTSPLQRLTCSNDGVLVPVPNPDDAYLSMGSYYELLSPGNSGTGTPDQPTWLGPVINSYTNTGTVLSVLVPVFDEDAYPHKLIGVVGVDLPVADIELIVNNYMAFPSYSFMANSEGEGIVHPLLPDSSTYTSVPRLYDIADIEGLTTDANFTQIRNDIVSRTSGEATLNKTVVHARGIEAYEGYSSWKVHAKYQFKPITNTAFTIVTVVASHLDTFHNMSFEVPVPRSGVTHLTPDSYHLAAPANRSSFSVAAKGFCNPVQYLDTPEDHVETKVIASMDLPNNVSCPRGTLKIPARYDIQSTSHVNGVWNGSAEHLGVTSRFIATQAGILRTFPGRVNSGKTDPTEEHWYKRGIANPGYFVASVPYTEGTENPNTLVYISKLVPYSTSAPATPSTTITYGVVGMTLEYYTFSNLFLDALSSGSGCSYKPVYHGIRCFMMDGSGYMLTHPSFFYGSGAINDSYIFVGQEEPQLARTFVNDGILSMNKSIDYKALGAQATLTTYSVTEHGWNDTNGLHFKTGPIVYSRTCPKEGSYFISKMGNTNMYLVVLNTSVNTPLCVSSPTVLTSLVPTPADICSQSQLRRGVIQCNLRAVSSSELDALRGIQNCTSQARAVLLGFLIPLGIGIIILFLIWFIKHRKRFRSMHPGALPHNRHSDNEDDFEPEQRNADHNVPNLNLDPPQPPNANDNAIAPDNISISINNSPADSPNLSSTSIHSNHQHSPRLVESPSQPSLNNRPSSNNSSPQRTPTTRSRNNSRSNVRSPSNNNLRNSMGSLRRPPSVGSASFFNPPPERASTYGPGNMYLDDERRSDNDIPLQVMSGGRAIVSPYLPTNISESESDLHTHTHTHTHTHQQTMDSDLTEEAESSVYGEEDEDDEEYSEVGDPDDLFAGMAREMGLPLPRTSANRP